MAYKFAPGGDCEFCFPSPDDDHHFGACKWNVSASYRTILLLGTSRGSISAVNAAASLSGPSAPDGILLTSALMSGYVGGRKPWVANTVFDLSLEDIRVPVLVVGHAEDKCIRSPPELMGNITARTSGVREQIVTVTGGPGWSGPPGIDACVGRAPHGFVGQEVEVAAGIARFIDGRTY